MPVVNMENEIKMLLELQGIDAEIFDRKRMLAGVPEKLKALDDALGEKASVLRGFEEELKKLQLEHKDKEIELNTKEQAIKKYQAQLFQVKTNKEYAALEKEIAGIKADNSLLEEEIIKLLDGIDAFQNKISKEREKLETEKKNTAGAKKKIEDEKRAAESEQGELNLKRKALADKIDKAVLSKYETILYNRDGLAMVPVVVDACGGCNMNLPPQVINEAKLKKELTFCGNCARILYSE